MQINNEISLQKQLFIIRKFGIEFPNSGSLYTLLLDFHKNKIEKLERRPNSLDPIISIIIDIKKFIDYLNQVNISKCKYKNIFLIQLFIGLRIGEVLALTIDDIDLKNNIIKVRKSLTVYEKGKIICGNRTKTNTGFRDVPINSKIIKDLKEQIKFVKSNKANLLFPNANNGYIDPRRANSN